MRIVPNNISNEVCPHCGKNICDPRFTKTEEVYRVTYVVGNRINYLIAHVDVPKCADCNKINYSVYAYPIAIFVIATLVAIVLLVGWNMPFINFVWWELAAIVVSLVSWRASKIAVAIAYRSRGARYYKPIQIMLKYDWQLDKSKFISPFNDEDFNKMIMEIQKEGYTIT